MKSFLVLIICFFSLALFSQVLVKGPWTIECGASSANAFTRSSSFNLRYISPRFKWSEEYIEEEEKNPEKFKNMRFMLELIYKPPLNVLCTGFNLQYRLVNYKKFSFEIYGGMKFFFLTGSEFSIPTSRSGPRGDIWYMNMGLLWQFNLGVISPFVDFGGDRIFTMGTEINFHKIYRKPKRRYKLQSRATNN